MKQVTASESESLMSSFANARAHVHGGGHYIPTSSVDRDVYKDFVAGMRP